MANADRDPSKRPALPSGVRRRGLAPHPRAGLQEGSSRGRRHVRRHAPKEVTDWRTLHEGERPTH